MPIRVLTLLIAGALALGLVACGDDEETQSLTFTITQQGKELKVTGPESAETGLAEITLDNEGKGDGDIQLIRVEGDHSPEEVIDGLEKALQGKALPNWFFAGGGVGTTGPGASQAVTQVRDPGPASGFVPEGGQAPDPVAVPAMEVTGGEADETVEAEETVSAFDYGF